MTLPANDLAPYWQQRWIEATNVGTEEIPAFTIVEVVDASRPETTYELTPGGGRTPLHVSVATQDSPPLSVLSGPMPIPVGRSGPVTDANIGYARYRKTIVIGDTIGILEGETRAEAGQTGYLVLGDITPDANSSLGDQNHMYGICRVLRQGGSGGSQRIGFLAVNVDHLKVQKVWLMQQVGTVAVNGSATLSQVNPPVSVDCLNITSLMLRGGDADNGPYMYVQNISGFTMPLVFPAQIEACLQPSQQLNTGAQ